MMPSVVEDDGHKAKAKTITVLVVATAVVLVALANTRAEQATPISEKLSQGTFADDQDTSNCLEPLYKKWMSHEQRKSSVSALLESMSGKDGVISWVEGDAVQTTPIVGVSSTRLPKVKGRLERLRKMLGTPHKTFHVPGSELKLLYDNDVISVDSDQCNVKAVYLGEKDGSLHPDVRNELEDSAARGDALVTHACLTCGQSFRGTLAAGTTRTLWVMAHTPLQSMTISTCNSQTNIFSMLSLEGESSSVISGTQCSATSLQQSITVTNIVSPTSTPLRVGKYYVLRLNSLGSVAGNFQVDVTCTCANIRRDWNTLTDVEEQVYTQGFIELRKNGKLKVLTDTHMDSRNSGSTGAHRASGFLPWHRYYLWEFERQIRALGGRYSCFTLSYWDWTNYDALPATDPIWTSRVGGNSAGGCLTSGDLTRAKGYWSPNNCRNGVDSAADVQARTCCLKRQFGSSSLATEQNVVNWITGSNIYTTFRSNVENCPNHNCAHGFIGGHMGAYWAPDDPMFWLLHTNVDFQWSLWQDCYNYEKVLASAVTSNIYSGGNGVGIDDNLPFFVLKDSSWAYVSTTSLSPRKIHSMFHLYQYDEMGLFTRQSGLDVSACSFDRVLVAMDVEARADRKVAKQGEIERNVTAQIEALAADLKKRHPTWSSKQLNAELARQSCIQTRKLAQAKGQPKCEYDPSYAKCGTGRFPKTLKFLLSKKGVKGNKCLTNVRKRFFTWARQFGELRDLCNGAFDPKC